MGIKQAKKTDYNKQLFMALKNNKKKEVENILRENPDLINNLINDKQNMTPIMVAAFYNAYDCTKEILKLNPDLTILENKRDCYFLAAERDNYYVLKDLYEYKRREKDIEITEEEEIKAKSINDNNEDMENPNSAKKELKSETGNTINNDNENNKDLKGNEPVKSDDIALNKNNSEERIKRVNKEIIQKENKSEKMIININDNCINNQSDNLNMKNNNNNLFNNKINENVNVNEDNDFNNNYSTLDWSILNMCYRCSYYLHCEQGLKIKDIEFYLDNHNKKYTSSFNFPLFVECLKNKTPRSQTPSFYLSQKQKQDLESHLPDPNETWSSFYRRMMNFELYKPPLKHKDSIPEEQKKTVYMRVQTKLLEIEYHKKSKVKNYY